MKQQPTVSKYSSSDSNNEPTKTIVATLDIDEHLQVSGEAFELQPFDHIVVRAVPSFKLQQIVTIEGEVKYPGLIHLFLIMKSW